MEQTTRSGERSGFAGFLDRYFEISARGSTISREIRGGLVTFFAMSYIIVINPLILGTVPDGTGGFIGGVEELAVSRVAAVTSLVAGLLCIAMGIVARFPLAIAAGMGLNAVVAYSIAALPDAGLTWADAMGIVVLEGIIMLVLVLTGFREAVFRAVPFELKMAISVGIGLFIAFVGLVNAGIIRIPASLATPVELGVDGSLGGWPSMIFVIGLFTAGILWVRKVRGALLIAIVVGTGLAMLAEAIFNVGQASEDNPRGWQLTPPELGGEVVSLPDFALLGHFSLLGSIEKVGIVVVILLVFTLMLADFFDTMGTMVAVGAEAKLLDEQGNPPRTREILVVDSFGAVAGGAASASTATAYIESAAGVGEGARTGLSSVVVGIAFLLSTFFAPLVALVPAEAATPVLVLVGFLMMAQVAGVDWKRAEVAIPAFLTILMMPLTFSIAAGMGAGFIAYVIIQVGAGRIGKVHPLMWITSLMFVFYFIRGPIGAWLGA